MVFATSCGYRPSAKFAREELGQKISTSVIISAQDPENTVVIKDALDSAIVEVFQASLVGKTESDTHLDISIGSMIYTPTVYDKDGYVIGYRMAIILNIKSRKNADIKNYNTRGFYDFSVSPNSLLTDQDRFDAIKFSSEKAIKSFIAKISADGAKSKKSKE